MKARLTDKGNVSLKLSHEEFQLLDALCKHVRLGAAKNGDKRLADFAFNVLTYSELFGIESLYNLQFTHEMQLIEDNRFEIDTTIEGVVEEDY